jgi:hypothetical protein
MPDEQVRAMPTILFGPEHLLQERYVDPEVQGGKIALIAFKQIRVQKPPNCLDRMHSRDLKQVAYNDRVIEAEKEVASINADAADFLSEMTLGPEDQVVICINGSEEMKIGEEAVAGQLWMQKDRHLTVYKRTMDGMVDSRETAILTAAADAVTWRHALELEDETRRGQKVIIYPKEMTKLTEVLSTKNPNVDPEDGHQLAYSIILQTAQAYEHPPLFMSEDNDQITSNEVMKESVAEWMNTAAKVATGNRRRVLEDGRDVMNTDEEDAIKHVEPDEENGMYAPGCSSIDQARMTQEQVLAQKAAAQAQALPKPKTPAEGSSDDDDPNGPESIWSMSKGYFRKNKHFRKPASSNTLTSTPAAPEPVRQPTPVSVPADPPSPKGKRPVSKAAAPQKAPADSKQTTGAKAPKPKKGQESPETKVSRPMGTRSKAKEAS